MSQTTATRGQAQTLIGILALEDESSGANIRTLHYDWLTSAVSRSGIYHQLRVLKEKKWIRPHLSACGMLAWGRKRRTPVYRLTEVGRRALVRFYADMLWLGHVNGRAHGSLMKEAEQMLNSTVSRVKAFTTKKAA